MSSSGSPKLRGRAKKDHVWDEAAGDWVPSPDSSSSTTTTSTTTTSKPPTTIETVISDTKNLLGKIQKASVEETVMLNNEIDRLKEIVDSKNEENTDLEERNKEQNEKTSKKLKKQADIIENLEREKEEKVDTIRKFINIIEDNT